MRVLHSHISAIGMLVVCGQLSICGAQTETVSVNVNQGNAAVATVGGDTVSNTQLTSFALQLEQSEGLRAPDPETVLNEYILTKLYNEIPTTATVEAGDIESSAPTEYKLVAQRSLLKRELRDLLATDIDVPRADMQVWYEQNVNKYTKPERIHAWHIFMETSEDTPTSSPEKARAVLQDLKRQIDAGTSFSQLAEAHSEAASSKAGGEIGKITRRMPIGPLSKPMNLELENALFALTPGKTSDVVDTRHGLHLLYVTEKETTRTPSLDDLISSGILPGVLAQDLLTSQLRTLVSETKEKYNGEVLPSADTSTGTVTEVRTETIAFQLDGKRFTVGHLMSMFGPRFTSYLESSKQDPESLKGLMEQALEDEAMVRAAIDKGLTENAAIQNELEMLGRREIARRNIDAIATAEAEAAVTYEAIQIRYDALKDELRQPEAEGALLMIQSEQATGTAEQARAREQARKLAEAIHTELVNSDWTSVTARLLASGAKNTSVVVVARHIVGQSTDTQTRVFDQAMSAIQADKGLSEAIPISPDYAIANLEKRHAGEAVPLAVVRDRLESMLKGAAQAEVRKDMVKRLEEKGLVKYTQAAVEYGKNPAGQHTDEKTSETATITPENK